MSVWLTPDLEPFFGGTYFPPRRRWGRPGFADLLQEIARLWRDERGRVLTQARQSVAQRLRRGRHAGRRAARARARRALDGAASGVPPQRSTRSTAASAARRSSRGRRELLFLLREYRRAPATRTAARHGGRARCARWPRAACTTTSAAASTATRWTQQWHVPHFEKMLYDQAQLVLALPRGARRRPATAASLDVAEDTLRLRPARHDRAPEGGFYSAEDADSLPPGAPTGAPRKPKGAFYVWTAEEIERAARRRRARRSASATASSRTATRRAIRTASSPGGTSSTQARRSTRSRRAATARPTTLRGAARGAADPVRGAQRAAASAPRRQDAHRVERPDDRRLRARGPSGAAMMPDAGASRGGGPAIVPAQRAAARPSSATAHVGRGAGPVAAALPRRRGGHRGVRGGLRRAWCSA